METGKRFLFSFVFAGMLIISLIIPTHANVQTLQTNKSYYVGDDTIIFSGTVEDMDTSLVTLVINDPLGEFVLLAQEFPNEDNTFEIKVSTKSKFISQGTYNATAFVTNMTGGSSMLFSYYFNQDSIPDPLKNSKTEQPTNIQEVETTSITNTTNTEEKNEIIDNSESKQEQRTDILEETNVENKATQSIIFPDPEKDPQHYINRYNNEPLYKEWFDKNFPDQTIYQVIGITPHDNGIVNENNDMNEDIKEKNGIKKSVKLESSSTKTIIPIEKEFTQMMFALGGIGILFGAVYGIKRKVDANTNQISKNRTHIEKSVRGYDVDPINILKNRLASGEINISQYNKIRDALDK